MKFHRTIALVVLAATLAACSNDRATAEGQDQPAAQSSNTNDMLLGGLLGYMLGSSTSRQTPAPAPQVTNIYQRAPAATPSYAPPPRPAVAPAPVAKPAPAAAPTPAPAPKPKPQVQPAPKPSYAGPSSYGSVRQSAPAYRAPSHSGGRR